VIPESPVVSETDCTRVHVRPTLEAADVGSLLDHLDAGRDLLGASEVVEWAGHLARWGRAAAVRAAVAIGRLHLHATEAVPAGAPVALGVADRWTACPGDDTSAAAAAALADARRTGALWATVPLVLIGAEHDPDRFRQLLEVAAEDACRRHAPDEVRAAIEARLRRWSRGGSRTEAPATRTVRRPRAS
jgi:hypothetical protein